MTQNSLFILGRQAAIGMAELESLYGKDALQPVNEACISSSLPPEQVAFGRLGGCVKLGAYLGTIDSSRWQDVQTKLTAFVLGAAQELSEGKVQIGLSTYGFQVSPKQLIATGLELKKALRRHGYSVRLTPNQEPSLSSAQVIHNHLTGDRGIELLIARSGSRTVVARSVAVQDITAYARRDQARPKRDAFIGMLPPKLAQTIVNLAAASTPESTNEIVLDPFCGTGVILQEALLMGYGAYGTDLEPRMIDYSRENLNWLATQGDTASPTLEVGDATEQHWQSPFSIVASETYLGHPLSNWPSSDKLTTIVNTCNVILSHFLQNIATQASSGTRFCLAIPAWINPSGNEIRHLPMLDHLGDLGYNRVSFSHALSGNLIYHRPGQLVGRELLVLTKQ
jgi:tRNA G10  N-methylase Trm11